MFIIGYLLIAIGKVLSIAINLYVVLIILDAVLSWIPNVRDYRITEVISSLVNPVLNPIRKLIPQIGVDISAIIAIVVLYFLDNYIVSAIYHMGQRLL
ncbi:MAG: YggT family protein [Candidatus Neomarinimicrobiota bacterium]|nr:MAG: YggT family protein [Candidatus Neomarinimicrobiota bacterium]